MTQRVALGSQWVLSKGQHKGEVVEVEAQTSAGNVRYRMVSVGDKASKSGQHDDARVHTVPLEQFLGLMRPKEKNGNAKTQSAFRQNNQLRKAQQMTVEPLAPAVSVPNGHYVHPGKSGLGIGVEMITPAMAQTWLDRGGANRKLNEALVARLERAIMGGEWGLTGDTIKLDEHGRVRDGQHRLTAIVRSGIAVPCLVVRGVAEEEFDKIDTGKRRDMSDVLSIHGYTSALPLASAVRGLIIIEAYGRYNAGLARTRGGGPSNAQGRAYIEAHPEVVEGLKESYRLRQAGDFIGGVGLWAIATTMFWRISPEQTRVFVDALIEGANLEAGSPILKLRNMYRGRTREWHATADNRERLLALAIKAWNAWRRDELLQNLTWHSTGRSAEQFPVAE